MWTYQQHISVNKDLLEVSDEIEDPRAKYTSVTSGMTTVLCTLFLNHTISM